jgi:DNA-3-methyladenine glycosylase II
VTSTNEARGASENCGPVLPPESLLSSRDATLAQVIAAQPARWSSHPTEDPIWGLVRIVTAQQISTKVACRLAERIKTAHPHLTGPSTATVPETVSLRAMGLPDRRAQCCVTILQRSDEIRAKVQQGQPWAEALADIKGIGPWTLSVFRIMVLREPDVLPLGDVGLERAIANVYGKRRSVERLSENWRPFRSVACWYLWRTLGNEQLG